MKFKDIEIPSNKKFGYFLTLIFLIITIYSYNFYPNYLTYISILILFFILFITLYNPKLVYPLNVSWMYFGFILSKIISPILVGFIFFIILTPIALILKLQKRDELKLKIKKQESYWTKRKSLLIEQKFFNKQF